MNSARSVNDLAAFFAVAREKSFTRAAAQLGVTQSALSHTVRGLEQRLGVRLLNRTTRSVATTEAGERLIRNVGPRLEEIDAELRTLTELREKPAGTIRITAGEHAAENVLLPALARLLPHYPDIKVEVSVDLSLTDIVTERFDAGVRLGEQVAKDMIAVPLGPELRMAVVASPAYFARHPAPKTPQQLAQHTCINLRLPTRGGLYAWEFEKAGRALNVRVEGQLVFNTAVMIRHSSGFSSGVAVRAWAWNRSPLICTSTSGSAPMFRYQAGGLSAPPREATIR